MRTTIDSAGRLVIPKPLRDQAGIGAGEVEISLDGAGLRVEPIAGDDLACEGGRLVVPTTGTKLDDATMQALIDADRR